MTSTARPDARRPRRSTSSPPTTASRSPTSSPTTRSTTRRTSRTTATATTTTAPGTAAPRGRPDDPEIRALRARQQRNFLATLLLSQGMPMLVAGDERGRTQGGNNNAWCQDNEVSWLDWERDGGGERAGRVHSAAACAPQAAIRCSGARASSTAARPSRCSRTRGGSAPTAGRWPSATGTSCDTSASS